MSFDGGKSIPTPSEPDTTPVVDGAGYADLELRLARLWPESPHSQRLPTVTQDLGLANFELREVLGSGAFGIVYLAEDLKHHRQVALKLPRPEILLDEEKRKRFTAEATLASGLDHPGIVQVFKTQLTGPTPYIVAAYCNGPNLAEWLAVHSSPPPWRESVALMVKIARAVDYAHAQGISHRDLKPANIMLTGVANSRQNVTALGQYEPKITDFGLAKSSDPTLTDTRSSLLIGTPLYMAPEQLDKNGTNDNWAATDIYAVGVILFEMLTGELPLGGDTYFEVLHNIRTQSPKRLRRLRQDLPVELETICSHCLRRNPQARYATAGQLADDLQRFLDGQRVTGKPTSLFAHASYWCTRPQRMTNAGWFAMSCQALQSLWIFVCAVMMDASGVITEDKRLTMWSTIVLIFLTICLPMGWAGWLTLHYKQLGAWLGAVLAGVNIPPVIYAIVVEPLFFRELYIGQHPYFSFNSHSMMLLCFSTQFILFTLAIISSRQPHNRTAVSLTV
jgi:serine/threonine protein kinase